MFTGLTHHKTWFSCPAKLSVVISEILPHQRPFLRRETSQLQNAPAAPHAHRCYGKVLLPNMDYSYPCLQARTATSCRQEPHVWGQFLPPGNVLTLQTLSYGLDHWNDNSYIFKAFKPQTVWIHLTFCFTLGCFCMSAAAVLLLLCDRIRLNLEVVKDSVWKYLLPLKNEPAGVND